MRSLRKTVRAARDGKTTAGLISLPYGKSCNENKKSLPSHAHLLGLC